MLRNYHTHTTFCDGKNTPEEIVQAAIEKGFDAIGFSGHCRTDFDLSYCMKEPDKYEQSIHTLQKKYEDKICIYLGIEEDLFAPVDRSKYDYIIGSSHYVCVNGQYYSVDSGADTLRKGVEACGGDPMVLAKQYFETLCQYVHRRKPDIVGHFDLVTKYEETKTDYFFSKETYWQLAERYMRELLTADCLIEVNTGAIARGLRSTPYPHERLLKLIQKAQGKVILSSDSHSAETLDFQFEQTRDLLRRLGFTHTWTWTPDGTEKTAL